MTDCRRHGFYQNVNGCPDCNMLRTEIVRKAFVDAPIEHQVPSTHDHDSHMRMDTDYDVR